MELHMTISSATTPNPTSRGAKSVPEDPATVGIHPDSAQAAAPVAGTPSGADVATDRMTAAADRAVQEIGDAAQRVSATAHRTADAAGDVAGELREQGAAIASRAQQRLDDLVALVRGFAREKPIESVAIALAVGLVVGRLVNLPRR